MRERKNPHEMTWNEVIAQLAEAQRGGAAFSEAATEAFRRVRLYGMHQKGRFPEAYVDDAVQTIILRLIDDRKLLEVLKDRPVGPGYFVQWIRNLVLSAMRSERPPSDAAANELREQIAQSQAEAETEQDELTELRKAVGKLRQEDQQLLRARFEFASIAEFAQAIGEPYSRVAKRVNRAVERLKEAAREGL